MRFNTWCRVLLAAAIAVAGCKSGGGGGGGSGGGSGGSASRGDGTCANTCSKSIALSCASGEHDQAACESSCEKQKAACSGQAAAFQSYLDCIESTPMECGATTSAPSSPQCVAQGLAIFQCALDGAGGGGGGGGGGGSATVQAAAESMCAAACACKPCTNTQLAGCVAEFSKTQPGWSAACLQLSIDSLDCITDKLSGCATTIDVASPQCQPSDAEIAAAGGC